METSESKFEIIHETINKANNTLSVKMLCEIAGVSRSGYYNWVHSADKRAEKEAQDRADFELVLAAYSFRGYDKGAQGIYMRLLHMNPPIVMNVKKIRRLMKKYGLICNIRKAINNYRCLYKTNFIVCVKRIFRSGFCFGNSQPDDRKAWSFPYN